MEESQALQRQMLLKHERDLENLKVNFWLQMSQNSPFLAFMC